MDPQALAREAVRLLRALAFVPATALAEQALTAAGVEGAECAREVARILARERAIFTNRQTAAQATSFFRTVYGEVTKLAAPLDPLWLAVSENLAGLLMSLDSYPEAAAIREQVWMAARDAYAFDDPRLLIARDNLAILYRHQGESGEAAALYANTGICAHLASVVSAVIAHGAQIVSCAQPWSNDCHLWVYLDQVLDCERLIVELNLDPCIRIHDHRGTHDGSERGLVCSLHHDGVMGMHPRR